MENNVCALCGNEGELYKLENEGEIILVCEYCYRDIYDANKSRGKSPKLSLKNDKKNKTNSHDAPVIDTDEVAPTNWTKLFKTINLILLGVMVLTGVVLGSSLFIDIFDGDFGGIIFGAPIGAVAGLLVGGVIVSFGMVIIEISQKLTDILDELRNK